MPKPLMKMSSARRRERVPTSGGSTLHLLVLSSTSEDTTVVDLATEIGVPPLVVADHGHIGGRRLIDYAPFTDPASPRAAILVEAGQHWEPATVTTMLETVAALLAITGLGPAREPAECPPNAQPRLAEVTVAVTATSGAFTFAGTYRGGDIIKCRNTLIAMDGGTEIRTPHDDCLLVMPSLRPSRGHTAVRLARFVD